MADDRLAQELERTVDELGYELVELERAGSRSRPILRLRIDRPDSEPGHGVSVDDCARVSRALEPRLDALDELSERYVLEVSSPGLERPLVRTRDFQRFAGKRVALKGAQPLAGRSRRLEGELLGLTGGDGEDGEQRIRLRLAEDEVVEVPRREVERAHLVFRWEDAG
jgi:ribosome maturation factor RimP